MTSNLRSQHFFESVKYWRPDLEVKNFPRWIDNELNGYADQDELPTYRVLNVRSYGHFISLVQQMKNAPIPPSTLPEEAHEHIQTSKIAMPISALANLSAGKEDLKEDWHPDLLRIVGGKIYERYELRQCVEGDSSLRTDRHIGYSPHQSAELCP